MALVLDLRMAFSGIIFDNSTKKYSRGFTLLELLVALLLISILSVVAIPSFQEWQERNAFKQFATRLTGLAKETRIHALTQGRSIYLITKINSEQCVLISEDKHCTCATHKNCTINNAAYWPLPTLWNLQLATSNGKDKTIAFNRHGLLNFGGNTTFTLTSQRFDANVIINTLGRVKLCSVQPFTGVAPC